MNRNEQVNGEKMWEYISKMGRYLAETMKEYKTELAVTGCSMALPIIFGCAEAWQESYREMSKINDPPAQKAPEVIVIRDRSLSASISELERINRQTALENSLRIRRMQLELKKKEAERKLQELYEP